MRDPSNCSRYLCRPRQLNRPNLDLSRHGHRLDSPDTNGVMRCPESGYRYEEVESGVLRCLDLNEEAPLPVELSVGIKSYKQLKEEAKYECSAARS